MRYFWTLLLTAALLAVAQADGLGTSEPIPFSMEGKVYLLPENTYRLPDFSKLKPVGSIYTKTLNVTSRSFDSGFPGVTDRFEWFAIDYQGSFYVKDGGKYDFRLTSDDGSKLIIDGKLVIDNDGGHAPLEKRGSIELAAGVHSIRVPYFQGPRHHICLVLEVSKDGSEYEVFIPPHMALGESKEDGKGGVRVSMQSAILFDYDKSDLKPAAQAALRNLKKTLVDRKSSASIVVEGHADSRGSDVYNQALSERRARAVKKWLMAQGVSPARVRSVGYGESKPKASNETEAGRAANRRVELLVR